MLRTRTLAEDDEPLHLSIVPTLPFLPDPLATWLPLETHQHPPVEEGTTSIESGLLYRQGMV